MKTFKTLFVIAVICLIPMFGFAAGTIEFAPASVTQSGFIQIQATCTADAADGSYPVEQIPYKLGGKFLHQIRVFPGATGPTADSDLYIPQHITTGYDLMNGAGENQIDNGTSDDRNFQPTIDSAPATVGVFGTLFIEITGNSVNSAVVVIVLDFIDMRN